jgi:hypothetical protein
MNPAARICARLIREAAVARSELPELDLPDVRDAVEQRLGQVGLVLATSAYSEHVGVRLAADVTAEPAFDSASNAGLRSDACALLVLLWARLVLQKRTVTDSRGVPGQGSLLARDASQAARSYNPQIRLETIFREFGDVLGSRTHLKRLVSQLRRLRFIGGRGDTIEAGPLLELGIDGDRMVAFIRRGVLAQMVEERERDANREEPAEPRHRILEVLEGLGGSAGIQQLEQATGEPRALLRRLLKELIEDGRVTRTGERAHTRYHRAEEA